MPSKALVIGGSGGIGAATAQLLLDSGWHVAVADLQKSNFENFYSIDVTSTSSIAGVMSAVNKDLGGINSVINCAGILDPKPTVDVSDESWERMISVHLSGSFYSARESMKYLDESGNGSIVFVSSVVTHLGLARRASYTAAKGGIEALTRSLAVEWAPNKIRVNAIAPGYTKTPITERAFLLGTAKEDVLTAAIPLGRMARSDEMARTIRFLASDESSFITGQIILVDGGMSINSNW
jgi:NAD(P)-dependent dehydrogenase (short-subunit alcohol dehydrogenase family)